MHIGTMLSMSGDPVGTEGLVERVVAAQALTVQDATNNRLAPGAASTIYATWPFQQ